MTFEEVKRISEFAQAKLQTIAESFPWENKEAYLLWLTQSYEYASQSTRILALTAGNFPANKTNLSNRFIQHAAEEKGHEKLLKNDAKQLGFDIQALPVLAEAEAFHKSLYFWIFQGRPSVILGWVLCLECFAVINGPKVFDRVEKKFGKKAASFLFVHAHEDPDHVSKAFEVIKDLSNEDRAEIVHGIRLYAKLYASIYFAIERESVSGNKMAA